MSDFKDAGIAVAAMAMHEVLIRILIERGIISAGEIRIIIDHILLRLENRHGNFKRSERGALDAEMIAFRNLLEKLSAM